MPTAFEGRDRRSQNDLGKAFIDKWNEIALFCVCSVKLIKRSSHQIFFVKINKNSISNAYFKIVFIDTFCNFRALHHSSDIQLEKKSRFPQILFNGFRKRNSNGFIEEECAIGYWGQG